MFRMRPLLLAVSLLFCCAPHADAQQAEADQVEAGRKFAERVCGNCHVTAAGPTRVPILDPPAPSFVATGRSASLTELHLQQLLTSKHAELGPRAQMPNPELADYQIDEIVAYFMTLKK
jgi:mono/diheme cytochrome c family protein